MPTITVYLDNEKYDKIQKMEGTRSQVIQKALDVYFEKMEKGG